MVSPAKLGVLFGCLVATGSTVAAPPRAGHPLLGIWRLALPERPCRETVEFRPDGTSYSVSARQRASGIYEVSDRALANGRYVLTASITSINAHPDCFGDTAPVGVVVTSYLQLYPGHRLFFCPSSTSTDCYGPYVPVAGRPPNTHREEPMPALAPPTDLIE